MKYFQLKLLVSDCYRADFVSKSKQSFIFSPPPAPPLIHFLSVFVFFSPSFCLSLGSHDTVFFSFRLFLFSFSRLPPSFPPLSTWSLLFLFFLTSHSIFIVLPPHSHPSSLSSAPSLIYILHTLSSLSFLFLTPPIFFLIQEAVFLSSLAFCLFSFQPFFFYSVVLNLLCCFFFHFSFLSPFSHIFSSFFCSIHTLPFQYYTSFLFIYLLKPAFLTSNPAFCLLSFFSPSYFFFLLMLFFIIFCSSPFFSFFVSLRL